MKTHNFAFSISIIVLLFYLAACNNSNDSFSSESTDIEIHIGERQILRLKNTYGICSAQTESFGIVEVTVKNEELEIFAKDEGTTVVRITNARNESLEIRVTATLNLEGIWKPKTYTYSIQTNDDSSAEIRNLLENNLPYATEMRYVFAMDGKIENIAPNLTVISYHFKNGQLKGSVINSDKEFFYNIQQWTKYEMSFTEDLTEYFHSLYPNKKIDYVKRNIKWERYLNP